MQAAPAGKDLDYLDEPFEAARLCKYRAQQVGGLMGLMGDVFLLRAAVQSTLLIHLESSVALFRCCRQPPKGFLSKRTILHGKAKHNYRQQAYQQQKPITTDTAAPTAAAAR